jgi:hypothetical protein
MAAAAGQSCTQPGKASSAYFTGYLRPDHARPDLNHPYVGPYAGKPRVGNGEGKSRMAELLDHQPGEREPLRFAYLDGFFPTMSRKPSNLVERTAATNRRAVRDDGGARSKTRVIQCSPGQSQIGSGLRKFDCELTIPNRSWIGFGGLETSRHEDTSRLLWECFFCEDRAAYPRPPAVWYGGLADGEDVALSDFDSFFRDVAAGRLDRRDDRNDLWLLAFALALRKARNAESRGLCDERGGVVEFDDEKIEGRARLRRVNARVRGTLSRRVAPAVRGPLQ